MTFWSALPRNPGSNTTEARCPVPWCWQFCPSAPTSPYTYCPVREIELRQTPEKASEGFDKTAEGGIE